MKNINNSFKETMICGEIRFVLKPKIKATFVSESMLRIMNADIEDTKWIDALKNEIFLFMPTDQIANFEASCLRAQNENIPVYIEHTIFDYKYQKLKVHGLIYKKENPDEFVLLDMLGADLDKERTDKFINSLSKTYDDVLVVDTQFDHVDYIKAEHIYDNYGIYSYREFKNYFIDEVVYKSDRKAVLKYITDLTSNKVNKKKNWIQFRIIDKDNVTQWFQFCIIKTGDYNYAFCFSNITETQRVLKLQEQIDTDYTTGLMNRDAFIKKCDSIDEKDLKKHFSYLALIEIYEFMNYTLEQQEKILIDAGEIIKNNINEHDLLARFSEKIFILYLKDSKGIDNRMKDLLKQLNKICVDNIDVVFSIGYAPHKYGKDKGFRKTFEDAREALKYVFNNGGNEAKSFTSMPADSFKVKRPTIRIQTFGYFEIFVDGVPVLFKHHKAKELLAVLIDRKGGFVTSGDVISYLWEDEPINTSTNGRYRKAAMYLNHTLKEYGIDYIVETTNRQRRIITDVVECDLYKYLANDEKTKKQFDGTYMANYSWAESTASYLLNLHNQ